MHRGAGQLLEQLSLLERPSHRQSKDGHLPNGAGAGSGGRHGVFGALSNRVRCRWRCWDALRGGKWVLGVSKRGGDGVVIFSLLQQRGSVRTKRALRTGSCNSPDGSARGKAAGTGSTTGAAMAAAGLLAATASQDDGAAQAKKPRKYEDFIDHDEDEEEDDDEEDNEDNGELSADNDDDAGGAAGELAAYERVC